MRRNATLLGACLAIVVVAGGCGLFKKKGPEFSSEPVSDLYAPAGYGSTTGTYDPYASGSGSAPGQSASSVALTGTRSDSTLASSLPAGGGRYHTVARHDTLFGLARLYYNDPARWKDIYEANRGSISDPNKIRVGQRLLIP